MCSCRCHTIHPSSTRPACYQSRGISLCLTSPHLAWKTSDLTCVLHDQVQQTAQPPSEAMRRLQIKEGVIHRARNLKSLAYQITKWRGAVSAARQDRLLRYSSTATS